VRITIPVPQRRGITVIASILYWLHLHQLFCRACSEFSVSCASILPTENTQTYSSSVNFVKKISKHHAQITLLGITENGGFQYPSISNTSYTNVPSQHNVILDHDHILQIFLINVTILY
jgi:hypothetical protein